LKKKTTTEAKEETEKLEEKRKETKKKKQSTKKRRKFKQTIEAIINLKNVDLDGKDKLNLSIQLPKGRGKDIEIGIFADGDLNLKAKKLSKHVLNRKELESFAKDKRKMRKFTNECYWFLAQADLMPFIGKTWGIVLGPRGKMPQPIPPNIPDLSPIIQKFKNTVRIKSKKSPTIHVPIGIEDMSPEDLTENLNSVLNEIEKQIPEEKISSIYIKKTMSEPVKVF
jgi:large subunit ribosomal protein L1